MSTSPYHQAGKLMQQIVVERKSIKTIVFSSPSSKNNSKNKNQLLCSKSTYAQVCNTVQHKSIIDSILNFNSSHLRKAIEMDKARNQGLVYVLLYELLFGKYRSIRGGGKLKRCIMKFEKELMEIRDMVVQSAGNNNSNNNGGNVKRIMPTFPRYVRVNKLKSTTEEVVQLLLKETGTNLNNKQLPPKKITGGNNHDNDKNHIANLDIYQDAHVPDLLVLSPKTSIQWHESELITEGKVVLQDKSSCFSALVLVHGNDAFISNNGSDGADDIGDFIDATAAPGNKTLHLAALIYDVIMKRSEGGVIKQHQHQHSKKKKNNKKSNAKDLNSNVKVFAFDRSSSRISILRDRVSDLAPSVLLNDNEIKNKHAQKDANKNSFPVDICPIHQDFLKVDPKDAKYKNVKSILLDPSCSGSGIVNSPDRIVDATGNKKSTDAEKNRIESLSNFQLVALKHAMSFPQCMRIVYSTCSVHQRENEDVVAAAMNETNEAMMGSNGDNGDDGMQWELVSPLALKHWKRRGFEADGLTKEQSECLIRVNGMDGDDTNGFFVSYFERKKIRYENKTQQQLNQKTFDLIRDTTCAGVKGIYNGQYSSLSSDDGSKEEEEKEDSVKVEVKQPNIIGNSEPGTTKKQQVQEAPCKSEKEPKLIPKKAAKKLKWKQRQKEMKLARLKRRKEGTSNQLK